jgi:hypothetical protein
MHKSGFTVANKNKRANGREMKWAGTLMMTDGDDCCQNLGPQA